MAMAHPQYIVDMSTGISADDFIEASHKNIFSALYDSVKRGIQPTYAELISELDIEADRSEAARLAETTAVAEDPAGYMRDCVNRMKVSKLARQQQQMKEKLASAKGDERRILLAQISELDKELKDKRV